jgi:hypothetical protein
MIVSPKPALSPARHTGIGLTIITRPKQWTETPATWDTTSRSWCGGAPDDTPTNSLIDKRRRRRDACAVCRHGAEAGRTAPRRDERVIHRGELQGPYCRDLTATPHGMSPLPTPWFKPNGGKQIVVLQCPQAGTKVPRSFCVLVIIGGGCRRGCTVDGAATSTAKGL